MLPGAQRRFNAKGSLAPKPPAVLADAVEALDRTLRRILLKENSPEKLDELETPAARVRA